MGTLLEQKCPWNYEKKICQGLITTTNSHNPSIRAQMTTFFFLSSYHCTVPFSLRGFCGVYGFRGHLHRIYVSFPLSIHDWGTTIQFLDAQSEAQKGMV